MDKRLRRDLQRVADFIENEADMRAGTFAASHPYMRELANAQRAFQRIADRLRKLSKVKRVKK